MLRRCYFILHSLLFLSFSVTLLALCAFHIYPITYYNYNNFNTPVSYNHSIDGDPIAISIVVLLSLQLPCILFVYFIYCGDDKTQHFLLHFKCYLIPGSISLILCICLLFTKSAHWNCTDIYRYEYNCRAASCSKKRDTLCRTCDYALACLNTGSEDITRIDYITYTTIGVILLGFGFALFPCYDYLSSRHEISKEDGKLREIVKSCQKESFHHFYTKLKLFDFLQCKLGEDMAQLIYRYLKKSEGRSTPDDAKWSFSTDLGYPDPNYADYLIYLKVKQKYIKNDDDDEVINITNILL